MQKVFTLNQIQQQQLYLNSVSALEQHNALETVFPKLSVCKS